jgi:hypothetical protein
MFEPLIEGVLTLVRSDLNKCAGILLGQSIKNRRKEGEETDEGFLQVYKLMSETTVQTLGGTTFRAPFLLHCIRAAQLRSH